MAPAAPADAAPPAADAAPPAADAPPPLTIDALSDETLAACLAPLAPEDLAAAERACHAFRRAVVEARLFRRAAEALAPALRRLPGPLGGPPPPLRAQGAAAESAAFKRLCLSPTEGLARPDEPLSLIADALEASSTDQPEEELGLALSPLARTRRLACYWSSAGSADAGSAEAAAFHLAHPLCLVTAVQVRPYRAWFQRGAPIYSPLSLRVRLGDFNLFDSAGDPSIEGTPARAAARVAALAAAAGAPAPPPHAWAYASPEFPVARADALQTFVLPEPVLVAGGLLVLEILGRTQRQEVDGLYYTCLTYVRCIGKPLVGLHVQPPPADGAGGGAGGGGGGAAAAARAPRLCRLDPDPARGHAVPLLAAVAERGRHRAYAQMRAELPAMGQAVPPGFWADVDARLAASGSEDGEPGSSEEETDEEGEEGEEEDEGSEDGEGSEDPSEDEDESEGDGSEGTPPGSGAVGAPAPGAA
jgi:hypothetical protein